MKKFTILFALLVVFALSTTAQVAINADNSNPASSAMLDVKSTTKGMLVPRMTQGQMVGITSPADGLLVYNLTKHAFYSYYLPNKTWREVQYGTSSVASTNVVTTVTGRTWMDRNLGASEVATSKTDAAAYGDLYQWGRAKEGHQVRTSSTYDGAVSSSRVGHPWDGEFVLDNGSTKYSDWLQTQDNTLWQGVNGDNNPCPTGFRLPTQNEWNAEAAKFSPKDPDGAYSSPLKLTVGGYRDAADGSIVDAGIYGFYWTSTTRVSNSVYYSEYFRLVNDQAYVNVNDNYFTRARGASVRCILDE